MFKKNLNHVKFLFNIMSLRIYPLPYLFSFEFPTFKNVYNYY